MTPSLKAFICFIVLVTQTISCSAGEPEAYSDVDSFVRMIPGAKIDDTLGAYGELSAQGRKDWAGIVYSDNPEQGHMRQIVILTQGADGLYRVAAREEPENAGGGTGHNFIESVEISRFSIFLSSSWNWHGCGGGATHQFRSIKGNWRLIGVTFSRSNSITIATPDGDAYDLGDSVNIDRNVLTGNTHIYFEQAHKKRVKLRKMIKPEVFLLKDYSPGLGWSPEFDGYADC